MSDTGAVDSASLDRDPVEALAEEFLDRRRRGEAVSVSQYAETHPALAERIRELFPTLLLMEEFKPGSTASHPAGATATRPPGKPLERLGDFSILREIGRGGMGVVYEAEQESLGRHVALKVMPDACVASPSRIRRFHREAQAAARLHHTNIVPIFGVGEQDGIHYYVMQFIPGQGLDRVVGALSVRTGKITSTDGGEAHSTDVARESGSSFSAVEAANLLLSGAPSSENSLPPDAAAERRPAEAVLATSVVDHRYWRGVARIVAQAADALEYAHRQGILHRDIKPANLLLDNRGTVWIADFGLAKLADLADLTRSGDVVGTLRYMAPEQLEGKADARSDVYSLGLTLYELLTLRPAFDAQDRRRLIRQVTQEEPPHPRKVNPAIPRDLETIVVKSIASRPEHRYLTAGDLAADLRCFLEDRPIRARRITPLGRAWRWCRRNRAVAILASTAMVLLAAVAVVASVGYLRTDRALQRVSEERKQADAARRQADAERIRTKAERERAEANLRLATKAFEDIFSRIAAEPVAPLREEEDDAEWPEPTWENVVTDRDAAMLESMLKFYDHFAQQNQADVKLQKETARAYRRVGDIQRRLGQYERAETAYRRAQAAYQRLEAESPRNPEYLTALAGTDNDLGVVLRSTGRFADARQFHGDAQKALDRQSADGARLPESRFELARTYRFLSMMSRGRPPNRSHSTGERHGPRSGEQNSEAVEHNRQALGILAKLIEETPKNPRYRLAMAQTQRDRSQIVAWSGRTAEADEARREATGLLEQLVVELPNNPEYRYELAETYALPYRWASDGKTPAWVADGVSRAVEIGTELLARYPTVPEYRASLARSLNRSAEVLRTAGSLPEAEAQLTRAVALQRSLIDDFPENLGNRFFLTRSLDRLAEVQLSQHQPGRARETLEEAIAQSERLCESPTGAPFSKIMLGMQYASLAKVLREMGEKTLADEADAKANQYGTRRGQASSGRPLRPTEPPRSEASKER